MKMSAANSVLHETDEISSNKELLDGNQYIHTNNTNLLPRMDSGGLLDVATAASLYLSGGPGVLPPPDQYPPEEILSAQDLTEEDRKLAAALVAVQFVQQQKQQQLLLNDATVSSASNASEVTHNSLPNIVNIGSDKIGTMDDNLVDTQLLFSHDNKSSMNSVAISQYACPLDNNRLSHIKLSNDNENTSANNIKILNQNSRKSQSHSRSKNTKRSINNKHHITGGIRTSSKYSLLPSTSSATSNFRDSNDFDITIKSEDDDLPDFSDDLDSDFNDDVIGTQSAKKSLPHKKRISRKLKTNPTKLLPAAKTTNLYPKCIKCTKCGEPVRNIKDFNKDFSSGDPLAHTNGPITFHCQICSQIFDSQLMFYEHLKTHYEPAAIVEKQRSEAILQTESFKQLETIKQGSVMVTFPAFTLKCPECGKTFRRQKAFDLHMRDIHPKVNKMEMEEFSETEDLMEGIRVVVDGESCGNDNGVNVLTNGHQTHPGLDHIVSIRNSHSQQILTNSNVIVSDSKVWYREDDELHATEADLQELEAQQLKEQQIQLENSITSYICHLCGSVFEQRIYLQQHMSECYLVLKQEAELLNSPSQVIGKLDTEEDDGDVKDLINKKYRKKKGHLVCKICDRVFNHRNSLVYHLRSHSGERPHQCEQCGKSFFATSALKVHMRLHSGDKPYKCEFCGRHFRQWGDLKYHCISLHSNKRQYQCEYCGKDFARKYSLIVHRRIHTGEKNYECEYCKKTFRASSYLQNHRKIHTGEKPHPCEICGKPFRVRSDMKRHMNTHNRDRFNKGCSSNDIKTNLSSDSEQAEMSVESANNVTDDNNVPANNTKEKEEVHVPLIPKTEASVSVKTIDPLQTPKEEDLSAGTLYTVPGDPLTIKEGNNTVYVWPVYMS